ncbi:hypothetical protein BDY17DRAFT_103354 [Neohortaea acidophila]|uniref:Uncharacterized protein n=1 Tax=Neohortaea acidophila TaxID=245834 RepID=A0A6A6Q0C2_9PEZI|nr:uncharacterized protein BDY17DRAFT_103354 [Neohortaea acidophila]KAF2485444.1 hypothetical protein BDY17DRAFT_103354 [Neohortaea acidophila]
MTGAHGVVTRNAKSWCLPSTPRMCAHAVLASTSTASCSHAPDALCVLLHVTCCAGGGAGAEAFPGRWREGAKVLTSHSLSAPTSKPLSIVGPRGGSFWPSRLPPAAPTQRPFSCMRAIDVPSSSYCTALGRPAAAPTMHHRLPYRSRAQSSTLNLHNSRDLQR